MEMKMTLVVLMTLLMSTLMTDAMTANDISHVLESTMPAYAIAKYADVLSASSICRHQLQKFREGVEERKIWSLRMLDASGTLKPGFLYGNNFWVGSKTQCHDTNERQPIVYSPKLMANDSLYRDKDEETPPYPVNYFAAHFRHNSTNQYHVGLNEEDTISLGLCLPDVCRPDQFAMILENMFRDRTLSASWTYKMDFTLLKVKNLKHTGNYLMNWRTMTVGVICLVTLVMVIIGTCYDLCVHQKRVKKIQSDTDTEGSTSAPSSRSRLTSKDKIALSFSAYENAKSIFHIPAKRSTDCLDGLKFISMGWVILVHSVLSIQDHTDNNRWSFRVGMGFLTQIVTNGSFAVDTYFVVGGFLTTWSFLKANRKKNDQPQKGFQLGEFLNAAMKRFMRLTPAYLMVIGLAEIVGGYFQETSQLYIGHDWSYFCSNYWWRNLLYIHNIYTSKDMCVLWSWYMSNDMQYFLIATVVLLISRKYFMTSVGIGTILIVSSIILTGYITWIVEYIPTIDSLWDSFDTIYIRPWTRIGPYIMGMGVAYLVARKNDKLIFTKRTVRILWTLSTISALVVIFALYPREFYFSKAASSIYAGIHRIVFSLSISWIIIACIQNYGGLVNSILSFQLWIPGSRLNFCAYLLNPLFMMSLAMHDEVAFHMDLLPNEVWFFGIFVVTFILAFFWSIIFELPYANLSKLYYDSRK